MSVAFASAGSIATATITALSVSWTMGAWIWFPSGQTGAHNICDIDDGVVVNTHQRLRVNNTGLALFARQNYLATNCSATSADGAIVADTWQFVAAQFEAFTATMRLYVGGLTTPVAQVSYAASNPITGVGTIQTGSTHMHVGNIHAATANFVGRIRGLFVLPRFAPIAELEAIRLGYRTSVRWGPRILLPLRSAADLVSPVGPVTFAGTSLTDAVDPPARLVLV